MQFHPNSEVPVEFQPGNQYNCGACGVENALHIDYNSDGEVVGKCYSDACYL